MKRLILILTVICIVSLSCFLFTGCPALNIYYIKFKVDGEGKIWDKGYTDYESNAFGSLYPGEGRIRLVATPDAVASTDDIDNYIWFRITGISAGTYPNTEVLIWFKEDGGVEYTNNVGVGDMTVIITEFGEIGGVIKGTFSGTLDETDSVGPITITEGEFEVLRAENDLIGPS
jgi:hypothetical protein